MDPTTALIGEIMTAHGPTAGIAAVVLLVLQRLLSKGITISVRHDPAQLKEIVKRLTQITDVAGRIDQLEQHDREHDSQIVTLRDRVTVLSVTMSERTKRRQSSDRNPITIGDITR
jgi:hypothetical protein